MAKSLRFWAEEEGSVGERGMETAGVIVYMYETVKKQKQKWKDAGCVLMPGWWWTIQHRELIKTTAMEASLDIPLSPAHS